MTDRAPKPAAGRPRREHSASNAASHRRHDLASPVGLLVLTLVLSTGGCLTTPGDAYPPPPTADGGPREISTEPLDRAVADDAPPPDAPSLDTPNPPPDSSRVDASPEDRDARETDEGHQGGPDAEAVPTDAGCAPGRTRCDDACVDLQTEVTRCGQCATDCLRLAGIDPSRTRCDAGRCVVACAPGRGDCDGRADTGCETDLGAPTSCGACGARCDEPAPLCALDARDGGASARCASGCGGMAPLRCNARCVDPMTSVEHCGGCGRACPEVANGATTCSAGACVTACNPGFHRCGARCLADLSVESCGSSCSPCPPPPPNATATCDGTSCSFVCNAGYHRCGDRCAANASVASCGMSCVACEETPNATATCDGVSCSFACNAGYHRCGGRCVSNASVDTCGASCAPCPAPPANGAATCDGTSCGFGCNAGFTACGARCLDTSADVSNCGACGRSCAVAAGAPACVMGRCEVASCAAGFADCDRDPSNGCEASLSSRTSCGRCGALCAGTCQGGGCYSTATVFSDDFEAGVSNWLLGAFWSRQGTYTYRGSGGLRGYWGGDFGSGCEADSIASLRAPLDFSRAVDAYLEVQFFGQYLCSRDVAEVVVSTDGGLRWESAGALYRSTAHTPRTVSLSRYVGRASVLVGFRLYNGCEDDCGATVWIDDVTIRAQVREF